MTPFKHNIAIYQGATFRKSLAWKSTDENGLNPVPNDLTGFSARMHIRPSIDSSALLHELSTTNGGITLGGTTGTIDLFISDENTALIRGTKGVYDLELTSPAGDVTRLVQGTVTISPEVTRG